MTTDLGHAARKWTPTRRGFESFFGKYRGGGDHWTHQMAMNADTLSGGWWPGVDGTMGIDVEYRAPPVAQPVDLHRDIAGTSFEHVLWENGTHSTTLFGREAAAVIERHALAREDGARISPLFLYVAHQAPHWPIQPTPSGWLRNGGLASASPRRRHWCGIVTALDESMGVVTGSLEMTGMMNDTIIIALSDNGGDFSTGASNHPYRGTKMTPFEGGTRVAAFISSTNPTFIPAASRGGSSHAWAHVTDLFPSLCALVGCDASGTATGPLDGIDVWDSLVQLSVSSPRRRMVYNIDPIGLAATAGNFVAGGGGGAGGMADVKPGTDQAGAARTGLYGNLPEDYAAIRIGKWKLVEGIAGRSDWFGSDPAAVWGGGENTAYIMGPDLADYALLSSGGRLGDMSLGDGGQVLIKEGADFQTTIKRRWLFDLEVDPTERNDVSAEHPAKVVELLREIDAERQRMAPPLLLQAGPETPMARTEVQPAPGGGERNVIGSWADAPERAGGTARAKI